MGTCSHSGTMLASARCTHSIGLVPMGFGHSLFCTMGSAGMLCVYSVNASGGCSTELRNMGRHNMWALLRFCFVGRPFSTTPKFAIVLSLCRRSLSWCVQPTLAVPRPPLSRGGLLRMSCGAPVVRSLECVLLARVPKAATWLILPVVICLSQRLSHACLSIKCLYVETANSSLNQL